MTDTQPATESSSTARKPAQANPGARGRLALAVADAVDDVTGVRRTGGGGVEISTLFAGGRALGVRLTDNEVEVHVVAEDVDLLALSASVHDAVRRCLDTLGDDRPVLVAIDDIDIAGPGGGPS